MEKSISEIKGPAWLIVWNEEKWVWNDYAGLCDKTKYGGRFTDTWSCSSSKARIGDDVFLIKLGNHPKGIIAHGKVIREQYETPHYNQDLAAQGKTEKCIDVEFDRLLNYKTENIILQDELKQKCPFQHWSPQNSGIEIKPEVLPMLLSLWNETVEKGWTDTTDIEAEALVRESLQTQIKSHITSFKKNLSKFRAGEKQLEPLRQRFVNYYTMQRIINMTKKEYVVGFGDNSFCYRLETELQKLGNIHGSTAKKFGLYYGTDGDDKEEKYRFTKKFGTDPDKALEKIKEEIIKLRMAGEEKNYEAIRKCILAPVFRGKILATFFPSDYLGIFAEEHLDYFISRLGMTVSLSEDILDKQDKLVHWKTAQPEIKDLSNYLFQCFLYFSFGAPVDTDRQKERDDEYPREYAAKVNISTDQWKELLQDRAIFTEKDIDLVKRIYKEDNHAATCYNMAAQDGVDPSSYIMPVVALARRISDRLKLEPIYNSYGDRSWVAIVFWGRYREDSHFEWKLQPKLAKALQLRYPDLDEVITDSDDKALIDDLKQATLSEAADSFEYTGKAKQKAVPVFTDGHKTYPRDRKVAVNALAHAHYLCEIDGSHPTFIRKNSDKPYTEPHHLIPMAFSDEFSVSLDVEENVVSLCSNCHNQIHYGRDAETLLKKIYYDRKDALEKAGITISLERLFKMYHLR